MILVLTYNKIVGAISQYTKARSCSRELDMYSCVVPLLLDQKLFIIMKQEDMKMITCPFGLLGIRYKDRAR